jgi:hypothetical protein
MASLKLQHTSLWGLLTFLPSCSNGTIGIVPDGGAGAQAEALSIPDFPGDAETPATGNPQIVADWLKTGAYRKWRCEALVHQARSPSPHGSNRVCSNRKLADHGAGEFPIGAASVKEVYDDLGARRGYAIGKKVDSGTAPAWVWFMMEGSNIVANARGIAAAAAACTGCHAAAGTDAQHSGHDFVYTIVPPQVR